MGQAGSTATTTIAIDGDGQAWSATSTNPAVTAIPSIGAAPGTVAIRADATGLDPGHYDVTVTFDYVDSLGTPGSASLAVDLRVTPEVHRSFFPAARS